MRVLMLLRIGPLVALAVLICGCVDATGSDVQTTLPPPLDASLDASIVLSSDTVAGWTTDTVQVVAIRQGPDAARLPLDSVRWRVTDTTIASIVAREDSVVHLAIHAPGETVVEARFDTLQAAAVVTAIAAGEVLALYAWSAARTWVNGVAIAKDGTGYLLRTDPAALLAIGPDLEPRWEVPLPGAIPVMSPAIGSGGTIYATAYGFTGAFLPDGSVLWQDTTMGNGETAPAVDGAGDVYVAATSVGFHARFFRYDATGRSTLLFEPRAGVKAPPVIVGDSVVVWASRMVWGVSRTGSLVWVDTLPGSSAYFALYFAPSVGRNGTVYIPTRNRVLAYDGYTGQQLWGVSTFGSPTAPVVDVDGTIYVQTDSDLTALNPDGTVRWQVAVGGGHSIHSGGAPALAEGGILYVGCGAAVCAVRTADGSVAWRRDLPVPGIPGPLAIAPDSSIVFTTVMVAGDSAYVVKLRGRRPLADAPWPMDGGNPQRTRRASP